VVVLSYSMSFWFLCDEYNYDRLRYLVTISKKFLMNAYSASREDLDVTITLEPVTQLLPTCSLHVLKPPFCMRGSNSRAQDSGLRQSCTEKASGKTAKSKWSLRNTGTVSKSHA
jgi:hypothetical protein